MGCGESPKPLNDVSIGTDERYAFECKLRCICDSCLALAQQGAAAG